jgi:hypothetical protein
VGYDPNDCPCYPEETAEAYFLGTLGRADAESFEAHYVACSRCLQVLADTEPYIRSMQEGALRFRPQAAAR